MLRTITTRWMDNDQYGHVNNVVYYSYFDTAVNGYLLEASGCDVRELPAIGIVAETSCRFLSELSFPDTRARGARARDDWATRASSTASACSATRRSSRRRSVASCTSTSTAITRRPVPVPAQVRAALETLRDGYVGTSGLP